MKRAVAICWCLLLSLAAIGQEQPRSVTVPITLDHNRTIIDVYLPLPDGKTKRVRAWVDNGNPELEITESLAQKLGLTFRSEATDTPGGKERKVRPPASLEIGKMTVTLTNVEEAHAVVGRDSVAPGCSAEINLPATVLRDYDILFDYPNRQFTIGAPGSISFQGKGTKATINSTNALLQIPSKIDGQDYNIAFDAGSSISLLSADLLRKWHESRPAWPQMVGAIGAANMWGAEEEARWQLLRVPTVQYGDTALTNVVVASFPEQFMKWYADRAGVATVGLLGANAFVDYRVGIDYAHSMLYVQRTNAHSAPDFDVVGVILRPESDDRYTILGTAEYNGEPAVPDVKPGDVLVGIDGAPATGATMGQVWSLLGGTPGQTRALTLERDGKRFTVQATVRRFLAVSRTPVKSPRRNPHARN